MSAAKTVNTKARQLVRKAAERGMSYDDIAELCSVSVGSVKRWAATGRADGNAIEPLEKLVGAVYLAPETVADDLVELYRKPRRRRFRITKTQLRRLSGRADLREKFMEALVEALSDRGYFFLPGHDDDQGSEFFIVISHAQLAAHVSRKLTRADLEEQFLAAVEAVVDEDDE